MLFFAAYLTTVECLKCNRGEILKVNNCVMYSKIMFCFYFAHIYVFYNIICYFIYGTVCL